MDTAGNLFKGRITVDKGLAGTIAANAPDVVQVHCLTDSYVDDVPFKAGQNYLVSPLEAQTLIARPGNRFRTVLDWWRV